jgi:WD40 repeat protein
VGVVLLLTLPALGNAEADDPVVETGDDERSLKVGANRLDGLASPVLAMAFSFDGKTLAIGHAAASITLWEIAERRAYTTELQDDRPNELGLGFIGCLAFAPDGQTLACGVGESRVVLWDVGRCKTTTVLRPRGRPSGPVQRVAYSADGRWLVKQTFAQVPGVELWSVRTRRPVPLPRGFPPMLAAAAFSPDGKTLAYGGWGSIRFRDFEKRRVTKQLTDQRLVFGAMAFFDGGRRLAIASGNGVWHVDIQTGEVADRPIIQDGGSPALTFAWHGFSPDGSHYAVIPTGGGLRVWDVASRTEREPFWDAEEKITCVAFSPDGKRMATGSVPSSMIRLWEIPEAKGDQIP